ncbi:2-oxoacid:acceptor oxidoreductase family protein [candidate division WOR-3 bacterium]|nr:2-oxoacid:acceptor oxidoreductase family protein [candidate division WOR-3 bacterium]
MIVSIRVAGSGGQGAVLSGIILANAAVLYEDKHATQKDRKFAIQTQSYGPEVRGTVSKSDVRISDQQITYPYVTVPDYFIILSEQAYQQQMNEIGPQTVVILDRDLVTSRPQTGFHEVPAHAIAKELGKPVIANIVMLGMWCGLTRIISWEALEKAVLEAVPRGSEALNMEAMQRGFEIGIKAANENISK